MLITFSIAWLCNCVFLGSKRLQMQLLNCKYIILPAIKTEDQTKCLICINSTNYVFMNSTRSKEYILNQKSMKYAKITGLSFTRWLEHNFCCICICLLYCIEKVSRATLDLCAALCSVGWDTLDLSHPQTLIFSNKPHKTKRSISQGDRRQLSLRVCFSLSHSSV